MQATHSHRFLTMGDAKAYALAGNATITLESAKTGVHFTYKVRLAKEGNVHFVSLLSGPNNESDFQYLGIIREGRFTRTKASRIGVDAPSFKAFGYFWAFCTANDEIPAQLVVRHEGKCGRCGRTLTVPESIDLGIGPECASKMNGGAE